MRSGIILLTLSVFFLTACGSLPVSVPVPTVAPVNPTPTQDIAAMVAAGIAATIAANPTATQVPPTPTATPIPTPTPTATPLPTPTPSLIAANNKAKKSVVRITSGNAEVSGVVIGSNSASTMILTVSQPLGASPLVTVLSEGGESFNGWVVGRDDELNLAVFRIMGGSLPGIPFGDSSILKNGDRVLSLSYPAVAKNKLLSLETKISGDRTNKANGVRFLQTEHLNQTGTNGAPLVNHLGEVVGIAVSKTFVEEQGFAAKIENFSAATEFLEKTFLSLQSGSIKIRPRPSPKAGPNAFPPMPTEYNGTIQFKGSIPTKGSTLYMQVNEPNIGDTWISTIDEGNYIQENGAYLIFLTVSSPAYRNSLVNFYMDGIKAEVQGLSQIDNGELRYTPSDRRTLNLIFT